MVIEPRAPDLEPGASHHGDFTRRVHSKLEELGGGRICELGAGANPAIELDFLEQHKLECLLVDVSPTELAKAPEGYATMVGDVSSHGFITAESAGRYDFVFSRVLAEHVRDARQFHLNVRGLLRPGGIAMHFFPTLWWPPFVANRLLPEAITERIVLRLDPWREPSGKHGKFPAYYHWCYGPTAGQLERLASVGFSVEHCVAYFGASSHAPGKALKRINAAWAERMLRRPNYLFTVHAGYTLRAV